MTKGKNQMRLFKFFFSFGMIFCGIVNQSNAADPENGKIIFKRCIACHYADKANNKVGPTLKNVIGRQAGSIEGYRFSAAMTDAGKGGLVWTKENLLNFLHNPQAMVKGTRMASIKIKDDNEIDDLIAYLQEAAKETDNTK